MTFDPANSHGSVNRLAVLNSLMGLAGQTFIRETATGGGLALGSGGLFGAAFPFAAGDIISTVYFSVVAAPVAPTLIKHAVFSSDGVTRLAVSASNTAAYNTTGVAGIAMTTPYVVPANGVLYLVTLQVAGTAATILGNVNGATALKAFGSYPALTVSQAGQADIAATQALAAGTTVSLWAGFA